MQLAFSIQTAASFTIYFKIICSLLVVHSLLFQHIQINTATQPVAYNHRNSQLFTHRVERLYQN